MTASSLSWIESHRLVCVDGTRILVDESGAWTVMNRAGVVARHGKSPSVAQAMIEAAQGEPIGGGEWALSVRADASPFGFLAANEQGGGRWLWLFVGEAGRVIASGFAADRRAAQDAAFASLGLVVGPLLQQLWGRGPKGAAS